jgi:histidinol dehydrogenase
MLPKLRNAGALFLGAYSPEPLGDYYAGPNHVLPTGGTAKFYSVLNVETFMKKDQHYLLHERSGWRKQQMILS